MGGAGRCDGVQAVIYRLLFARAVQNLNPAYLYSGYMWTEYLGEGRILWRQLTVFECLN